MHDPLPGFVAKVADHGDLSGQAMRVAGEEGAEGERCD